MNKGPLRLSVSPENHTEYLCNSKIFSYHTSDGRDFVLHSVGTLRYSSKRITSVSEERPEIKGIYIIQMGLSENLITMSSQQRTDYHHSNILPGRKSNLRLNDQILPKPTDVNMGEKVLKVPTPKEHPYASHIPRYSMFPSYGSSGSAKEGQRNVPNSAPDVILLSKTKGNAYRHELLMPPTRTKKAVTWAEEHTGFMEYPKPLKGESQAFYPTPTKLMHSKPKHNLLPSSDETGKMLNNLERMHWITSYQMHYSGYEKGNLKMDYRQKHIRPSGRNSHTAPQRDKPTLAFVSSTLTDDYRRTNDVSAGMIGPTAHLAATFPAPLQRTTSAVALPQRPRENSANCNEALGPNQRGHSQPEHSGGLAQAQRDDLPRGASHKRQPGGLEREEENGDKRQQCVQENTDAEIPLQDGALTSLSKDVGNGHSSNKMRLNPCVLPRAPVLTDIRTLSGEGPSLKELQDSFSKTQVHHRFNSSIAQTPMNLRDNVYTGRRHDFYGVNAFYLHG